jgi:hypothetical protein
VFSPKKVQRSSPPYRVNLPPHGPAAFNPPWFPPHYPYGGLMVPPQTPPPNHGNTYNIGSVDNRSYVTINHADNGGLMVPPQTPPPNHGNIYNIGSIVDNRSYVTINHADNGGLMVPPQTPPSLYGNTFNNCSYADHRKYINVTNVHNHSDSSVRAAINKQALAAKSGETSVAVRNLETTVNDRAQETAGALQEVQSGQKNDLGTISKAEKPPGGSPDRASVRLDGGVSAIAANGNGASGDSALAVPNVSAACWAQGCRRPSWACSHRMPQRDSTTNSLCSRRHSFASRPRHRWRCSLSPSTRLTIVAPPRPVLVFS